MQLHELVSDAARWAPGDLALVTEAGPTTFAELDRRVRSLADGLDAIGAPGDRIAILSGNRAEYVDCYYGVARAGRVLVPLNQRLHPHEWLAALGRAGARVLVGEAELLDRVDTRDLREAGVETIVGLDDAAPFDVAYSVLLSAGAAVTGAPERVARRGNVAWLVGTSGTTGSPKLATLTHASVLAAVESTLLARPVGDDDALLTPFPLCHVAGYNVLVLHRRSRPVILMRRFDPYHLAVLVREHHVTMLSLAPTMIAMLLDTPDVDDDDLATVRALGYGASSIPAPVLRAAVARWDWDLSQGYGMTELSGNAVFLGPAEHRAGAAGDERMLRAAGRPAPGVEVRIAPRTGEVLVRAPQVMDGYWADPVASAAALRGGWLHTGDVGRIDDDGLLTILDRLKGVIVSGGENVASREVEDVLHRHPAVADVAVIGLPDERWGERVCAVVVARGDTTVDAAELLELCRDHLGGFKTPRAVFFVAELPRNAAGKVLKQQLRAELAPDPGQDGVDGWRGPMDTDRNRDEDEGLAELVGIDDDALPRTERDEDEQEAADLLEVDQTELEELGLVLDDPHQPVDE